MDATRRDRLILAALVLVHATLFGYVYHAIYRLPHSDVPIYFGYGWKTVAGQLPYRDFQMEYPPLAAAIFAVPRLLSITWNGYFWWFQAELALADIAILVTLYLAARRLGQHTSATIGIYTLLILAIGPIASQRYDLIPAALTLLAVYAYWREREMTAAALLAAGTMAKIYPLLLVPLFVIDLWRRGEHRRILTAAAAFIATSVGILLPFLLTSPASLRRFFDYHAHRGIQIESLYASVLLALDKLNVVWTVHDFSFGSWNLTGGGAELLASLSTYVLAASLVATYAFVARRAPQAGGDVRLLASYALLVLTVGLVASKVLSPQYLIWLVPFVPLAADPPGRPVRIWMIFAAAALLTYYVFPTHYQQLLARDRLVITALLLRNALLVTMAVALVRASTREPHHGW